MALTIGGEFASNVDARFTMLDVLGCSLAAVTTSLKPLPAVPAASAPRLAARWWRRLDSLRVKLFLGIAGVNVLVVVAAYLVHGWSFDQGLSTYLNRADEARMAPLVERLAQGHAEHGSWQWLVADHEAWHAVLRDELGLPVGGKDRRDRAPNPAGGDADDDGRKGERESHGDSWTEGRLLLLDAHRQAQIGSQARADQALLLPIITSQGHVVGYLGRTPRRELVASLEGAISAQQGRQFAVIAAGMLGAVLVNAAVISGWLGRRLVVLGAAAAAVAQGDYAVRLPHQGHDELARLADDFNRMASSLQAAQRARQRWIADIAHELRTPLAGLQAEIEALQDGVRQPTPERFESLAQQVHRLTRLVDDLRLLSLSDLGALELRAEVLDLGELVRNFFDHPPVPCVGLQVQLDLADGRQPGLLVRADAVRLQQVLGNLLQNTLRYCDSPARLAVRVARQGRAVHLCWEDSAPGVSAADLPRLTERLFRVDDSRSRASGGSGLGLAIVRAMVEGHGGTLTPSASPLGGLAWDIALPGVGEEPFHG
jgi:two-component system sensor histidine kinase BaeS